MRDRIRRIISRKSREPEQKPAPLQSLVAEEVRRRKSLTDAEMKLRMERINDDFRHAFSLIKEHPDTVSVFGSSVLPSSSKYYHDARELARKVVEELGLTIVSGGGPGIMEAANRGAKDAKGDSVGVAIELPHEQVKNKYITHSDDFYYFFSRKVALTFTARAYIYYPGGFGTLDELFEILTLKETGKIPPIPIVLVGSGYWKPLLEFIENTLHRDLEVIPDDYRGLFVQEDDHDEIIKIIAEGKT